MSKLIVVVAVLLLAITGCKEKSTAFRTDSRNAEIADVDNSVEEAPEPKTSYEVTPTQDARNESSTSTETQPDATKGGEIGTRPKRNLDSKLARNRYVYLQDYVGGVDDEVYEAVKGQRFLTTTRIFIYVTDESMEGTGDYSRVEGTMESTRLDDRIFIWVHLDPEKNVKFKRTLISDNIEDKLGDANHIL